MTPEALRAFLLASLERILSHPVFLSKEAKAVIKAQQAILPQHRPEVDEFLTLVSKEVVL